MFIPSTGSLPVQRTEALPSKQIKQIASRFAPSDATVTPFLSLILVRTQGTEGKVT
jgi:hypothetical protein